MPPEEPERQKGVGSYSYDRDEGRVKIDLKGSFYGASVADFEEVMSRVIDILRSIEEAERVLLIQDREYEYDSYQTHLLNEIAGVLNEIRRQKIIIPSNLALPKCDRHVASRTAFLKDLTANMLRRDPIGAYVKLKRRIEEVKVKEKEANGKPKRCYKYYINKALKPIKEALENTEMIKKVQDELAGYHIGDRDIYRQIFHPNIRPHFMLTRYKSGVPEGAEERDRYEIEEVGAEVRILKVPGDVRMTYHISPPEFDLDETSYGILDKARRYMAEHEPTEAEFAEPERTREIFYNIGKDMIEDIAGDEGADLSPEKRESLANILTRYTAGLGIMEVLLADPHLQDIYVNSPIGATPIYAVHGEYGELKTNLIPTQDDAEAWATRFRMKSGRPLDEANPVLDTEAEVPGGRARVAIITRNLSPAGLGFAFRRHRSEPWTYPLFIQNNMFNPLAAGLMSFIIDGARTMLIAGTRSAGKTSLMSACLTELMKRYRVVTVEDTLELPVSSLRDLGYNVESMKSRSVITQVESELPADEAIRTALRLGDSCLILGEVRSTEAKALYEAMRIGALANFVGGTIHGESAYGVFDRVVNDLGVPRTSFKATDIVTICNTLKSPDGLHTYRRVTNITEVRKEWSDDPMKENAFVDLMTYDSQEDKLKPTDTLLNGESVILNRIASNVREWKNDWDAVWSNIQLRKNIKKRLVELAKKSGKDEVLEAGFSVQANEKFHSLSEKVKREYGGLDSDRIYNRWNEWAKKAVKEL